MPHSIKQDIVDGGYEQAEHVAQQRHFVAERDVEEGRIVGVDGDDHARRIQAGQRVRVQIVAARTAVDSTF